MKDLKKEGAAAQAGPSFFRPYFFIPELIGDLFKQKKKKAAPRTLPTEPSLLKTYR